MQTEITNSKVTIVAKDGMYYVQNIERRLYFSPSESACHKFISKYRQNYSIVNNTSPIGIAINKKHGLA